MQVKCMVCEYIPDKAILNNSLQYQEINPNEIDFVICKKCFDVTMKTIKKTWHIVSYNVIWYYNKKLAKDKNVKRP